MQVNDKQKQISKLLWDFQSLREEHVLKICNCTENDINCLIANKVLTKDKNTKILNYNAIKEIETDTLFEKIDEISKADKVIIIIETKQYIKKMINTKRPCYICSYPPLEIEEKIN